MPTSSEQSLPVPPGDRDAAPENFTCTADEGDRDTDPEDFPYTADEGNRDTDPENSTGTAAPENFPDTAAEEDRDAALEDLITAVAAGDREALGHLYAETRTAVFAFALSVVRDRQDAEDILQDVYVRVWQSAPAYRALGKPLAWILTITRNRALAELRRKGRIVPVAPEDWQEIFADSGAADAGDALILGSVLDLLEADEREIVVLHAVAGLKHRESAELLDLGLSTVLSKYGRALKKLRQALGEAV